MQYFAVLGNSIQHSKSPLIHQLFAEQVGIELTYRAIDVTTEKFANTVLNFSGNGLNITQPFKQDAYHLVHELSPRAQIARSINTIKFNKNGTTFGDNTDGVGLLKDLTLNKQLTLKNKTILIFGAGGAARGIIAPLLAENPASLVVANHHHDKALNLVHAFDAPTALSAVPFSALALYHFDLVINAANLTMIPLVGLQPATYCYDLAYGQGETPFAIWAKSRRLAYCDGLGMLIEQAAEAFYLWHKIYPKTRLIFENLLST